MMMNTITMAQDTAMTTAHVTSYPKVLLTEFTNQAFCRITAMVGEC